MKKAFIINILIVVLVAVATVWMMTSPALLALTATRLGALKYFTVDSNILVGIAALLMAVSQYCVLKGKKEKVEPWLYTFKLVATVGVAITMLVTVFYLGFVVSTGYLSMFKGSNFFFHLVIPVLSIVVFMFFEKTECIAFKCNFFSFIPLVFYGIYYAISVLTHMENGVVQKGYDWYKFFQIGTKSLMIVYPFFLVFAFLVSFTLWKVNKKTVTSK